MSVEAVGPNALTIAQALHTEAPHILQPRDVTVTNERWRGPAFLRFARRARDFEVKYTYAISRFALICSPVTGANHDPLPVAFFATQINHGMSDRRVALNAVGTSPEKEIAGYQFIKFEGVFSAAVYGFEGSRFTQPDILLARIARNITNSVLRQDIKDETGTIHPAIRGVGGTVLVIQVSRGQLESHVHDLADIGRVILIP
jgi:hypothetical protein